ncbi:phospholipid-transporting ATPase ABCA7 isoform X2 [Erinaceus europaeus]|nr:phospholipid-transporting ATPase ABCA7 isoform X2 [Erinaceus europaeus]
MLPSLAELRALLQSPGRLGGPLGVVSAVLCSAQGPSILQGTPLDWYEDSPLKEMLGTVPTSTLPDSGLSPACRELLRSLEVHPLSRLLWRRLRPLALGKLLFAPDTPFTRTLMAQVNQTFQDLALLRDVQEAWGVLGPQIFDFMNDSSNVALLLVGPRTLPNTQRLLHPRGPGGQARKNALRDFLDPSAGGYSWLQAHEDVGRLADSLGRVVECVLLDKLEALPSEEALEERALELLAARRFWAGVVILRPEDARDPGPQPDPSEVRIKIRMDIDDVRSTNKIRNRFWDPSPAADPLKDLRYVWGGFVYLQDLVERAAVRVLGGGAPPARLYLQQMPYPCYVDDAFLRALSRSLPLFLTLAWIYAVAHTVKAVVREKETRLRDTMRAMGLSRAVLWLGWFLSCLAPFLVSSALLVLVLKLGDILVYSQAAAVFLFLAAFAVATVAQSFLLSAFFSRANLAAACGGLVYFALYLPYVLCAAWRDRLPAGARVAASLLSQAAFGFGCESLALLEEQGLGARWRDLGAAPAADVFSLAQAAGFLLLDAALYGLATCYVEAVWPGQYGVPEPWNFPFRRRYWLGPLPPKGPAPPPASLDPEVLVEEAPPGLEPGVSLRALEKRFPGLRQPALHGLSLDFYRGHITAFLGHNGAGKTTTLSILSGLFPPSGGSATILGHDLQTGLAAIRPHLGVCPQHNVLFDLMTVDEHIWFYGRLKGLSSAAVCPEQEQLVQDVGLEAKRGAQARHLSGGMQRKLSVAIAFVGGSQVVILDEPTAGVDPASRRAIWELLLKYRAGRTLILSTHHLDEAELLGDRVAVVAAGRLRCCGSPLFLRRHLGSGYYLTLAKAGAGPGEDGRGRQDGTAGPLQLLALAQRHVPGARLVEERPRELMLALPYVGAQDGSFPALLRELDQRLPELGLSGYGISDTSLEEIFLKVVEDCSEESHPARVAADGAPPRPVTAEHPQDPTPPRSPLEDAALEKGVPGGAAPKDWGPEAGRLRGWALTTQQLRALLLKRLLLAVRSRRGLFSQVVLPALFVGLALAFSLIVPRPGTRPALRLSPAMYGPQVTFFSQDAPGNPELLQALLEEAGLGAPPLPGAPHETPECGRPPTCLFRAPEPPRAVTEALAAAQWTPGSASPPCQCSHPGARRLLPSCPPEAGGPPPPQLLTPTGELVQNLTGRNLSDFLVKTYPSLVRQGLKTKKWVNEVRYGGFSLGSRDPDIPSGEELAIRLQELGTALHPPAGSPLDHVLGNLTAWARGLDAQESIKIWFNNKGWHAMVAFLNRANNALLRAHRAQGPAPHALHVPRIATFNHPLNLSKEQLSEAMLMASSVDVLVSICVVFALSFVPASFTLVVIEERVSGAQHLQFLGGLPPTLYWLSNFLWDMCNYLLSACIVVAIFLGFQQRAYVGPQNLPALLLLLLLYGWSITPLMYPASFYFSVPSTAYVVLTCVNLFIGINGSMATFVLELFPDQQLQDVSRILKRAFLMFPHFCLGRGLIDMVRNQAMGDALERLGEGQLQSPLRWEVVGKNLVAMLVQGPLFLLVTLLFQHRDRLLPQRKLSLPPTLGDEDQDVAQERERVARGRTQGDVLVLRDLSKVYPRQSAPAVDRLCLGVPPGECFGLLGVNGAGKTSTFRMVTGDLRPSAGDTLLAGHSVSREPAAARRHMGYCPQTDALFPLLSGRQHLQLFARLRGVPGPSVAQMASRGLARMGLSLLADRPAGTYSGGNKRKLATAVALVGDPAVVFLDEPTTGMDPSARRFLWASLRDLVQAGCAVVLTSHSMEECEALCTRLAVLASGRFRCLGSPQHLKTRFGSGHSLTLRVPAGSRERAQAWVAATLPGAELLEVRGGRLRFQLPPGLRGGLARVFEELAAGGADCGLEDFSLSQTTLEEVFLRFSEDQGREAVAGAETQPPKVIREFLDDPHTAESVL